jgi:hypothetical protein
MKLSEYMTFTSTTNCYKTPDGYDENDLMLDVLVIGLAEELLEFSMEDTDTNMRAEAGDCLWYCSELLKAIDKGGITSFVTHYNHIVDNHGVIISASHGVKAALSIVKKYIRGDFSIEEKRARIWELVSIVFKSFKMMYDVDGIMRDNMQKLKKRIETNTIHGDNRESKCV